MLNKTSEKVNDPSGGANQSRVRDYNERLVLSLVRRHGYLAKSQLHVDQAYLHKQFQ